MSVSVVVCACALMDGRIYPRYRCCYLCLDVSPSVCRLNFLVCLRPDATRASHANGYKKTKRLINSFCLIVFIHKPSHVGHLS